MATQYEWLDPGLARASEIPAGVSLPGAVVVPLMKSPQKDFPEQRPSFGLSGP